MKDNKEKKDRVIKKVPKTLKQYLEEDEIKAPGELIMKRDALRNGNSPRTPRVPYKRSSKNIKRDMMIIEWLKQGYRPSSIIPVIQKQFDYTAKSAKAIVFRVYRKYNKSIQDLSKDAAMYVTGTLMGTIETCAEKRDEKTKIKALDLLARVTKVYEEKTEVNVVNGGFKFNFDESTEEENKEDKED